MQYLKIKEIAEHYNVSVRTIRNWVKKGMPVVVVGGVHRFDLAEVDKWIKG
jgi:excisionase family DNA binding protein